MSWRVGCRASGQGSGETGFRVEGCRFWEAVRDCFRWILEL